MPKDQPTARPLGTGGESGGGAYAPDAQAEAPDSEEYSGGQSIKNYHGSKGGSEANAAAGSKPNRNQKETDSGGL